MDSTHVFAPKWLFQSNNGSLDTLSSKPTQTQYLRSNHHYNSHNDLNDRDFPSLKQDTWSSRSAAVSPARATESVWSHSEARSKVVSPRVVPNNNNSNGSIRKTDITMKRPVPVPLSLSSIQSRNVSSMSQRDTTTRNSRIVLNPKAPAPIILADVPVKLPASSSLPSSSSTSSSSSSATNSPRADFDDYRPRSRSSVDSSYHPHNSNNISSMNNNNNHSSSSINGNNNIGFSSTAARLRRERELSGQEVPGAFHKTYSSSTTIDHHGYNQYPPPPQHRHVFEHESSRVRERASSTDSSSIRKIENLDEDLYRTAHEVETIDGHGDAWAEDSEVDRTPLQSISAVSSSSAKADVTLLTPEEDELLDHDEPNNLEVPVPTNIQVAEPIPIHPAPVPKHELQSTSSNKGQVLSESMEKEERFLRELGWQTPEDEEAPFLTAEEIETFASKLRVVRPSTNGDVRKATKVASKLALRSVKPVVAVVSADAGDIDATSPDED